MSIVNAANINQLLANDNIFRLVNDRYGAPPNWERPQGFISLCKIILEQQVSLASGRAHFLKLNNYLNEFTPVNILKLTDEEMRNCQISRQKAKYLRCLSTAILNREIDLQTLPDLSEWEVRKQLTSITGIGEWTTDIYLMFCLQATDIFPLGDIAVINTVKELSEAQTRQDIILLADRWRPFRSLAAYFLWHYYLKKRNRPSEQFLEFS
jgi:DNA-3-methyladenine glycosylase II